MPTTQRLADRIIIPLTVEQRRLVEERAREVDMPVSAYARYELMTAIGGPINVAQLVESEEEK